MTKHERLGFILQNFFLFISSVCVHTKTRALFSRLSRARLRIILPTDPILFYFILFLNRTGQSVPHDRLVRGTTSSAISPNG